jgi:hypothetical protein
MNIITPGHTYELTNFEPSDPQGQTLKFIHKEPSFPGSTEYKTVDNGTTNEEVLEMLINRLTYLQETHQGGKFKCKENACAITHLQEALHWLEARTKRRMTRGVEGKHVV